MSEPTGLSHIEAYSVDVSAKTTWVFLRLVGADGAEGIGEATVNGKASDVLAAVARAGETVTASAPWHGAKFERIKQALGGSVGRAVASGLEQAWLDREAKRLGRTVSDLLGGAYRHDVPSYANINRGTLSRSPEEFAERALAAIREGYSAVKLAPFDGLTADDADLSRRARRLEDGFGRVAAVANAVGSSCRIMVDCHSRLRMGEAEQVMRRLASNGVSWFEEPVAETSENLAGIAMLRNSAAAIGVTLAGAEKSADTKAILPFLTTGCYDVVMPDIILAGGPSEVVRIGYLAAALGISLSLHNPCGPVMDVHSAHVAAALPSLLSLERQFRESPLYDAVVRRRHDVQNGTYVLAACPGAGIELERAHPLVQLRESGTIAL